MFYVGIDWADQKHDALALDEAGSQVGSIRVSHTAEGLAKLDAWLSQHTDSEDGQQILALARGGIHLLSEQVWR